MERIKKNEASKESFIKVSKALFINPKYKGLSITAKMMYSIIKDYTWKSSKKGWVNANDEIYLILPQSELENMMQISHSTCSKTMKELEEYDLIERVRQGQCLPNHIYVGKVIAENETSGSVKNELLTSGNDMSRVRKSNGIIDFKGKEKKDEDDDKSSPKTSSSSSSSSVIAFFAENEHRPSPFEATEITALVAEYGEETVMKALKEAALKNKLNVKYVIAILGNWKAHGGDHNPNLQEPMEKKTEYWTPPSVPDARTNSTGKKAADMLAEARLKNWEVEKNKELPSGARESIVQYIKEFGADPVFTDLENHPIGKEDDLTEALIGMANRLSERQPKLEVAG